MVGLKHDDRKTERGNILWFILVAVALLAAITVVLSRSSSSVEQSGSAEHRRIKSSQIMRYAKSLESAIQHLQIKECSENEISFENTTLTGYTNAKSPADKSCHVFYKAGAGLMWKALTKKVLDNGEPMLITGRITVFGLGSDTGSGGVDLVVAIPVTKGICDDVNKTFGISTAASSITSNIAVWPAKYTGSFSGGNDLGDSAVEAPGVKGKTSGCVIDVNGTYVFYHVLIER